MYLQGQYPYFEGEEVHSTVHNGRYVTHTFFIKITCRLKLNLNYFCIQDVHPTKMCNSFSAHPHMCLVHPLLHGSMLVGIMFLLQRVEESGK